jgi:hypothetical protein
MQHAGVVLNQWWAGGGFVFFSTYSFFVMDLHGKLDRSGRGEDIVSCFSRYFCGLKVTISLAKDRRDWCSGTELDLYSRGTASILGLVASYPTWFYCDFPQSPHAYAWIIYYLETRHYWLSFHIVTLLHPQL